MRIGVLTAGGDCPGLNAVIRAPAQQDAVDPLVVEQGHRTVVHQPGPPVLEAQDG